MAKAKKKASKRLTIPPHPAVPHPNDIGELCADIFRHGVKLARQQGLDEQAVEQLALGEVREFLAACIRQSKADWKAYTKSSGVHAAYVVAKGPARKNVRQQTRKTRAAKAA